MLPVAHSSISERISNNNRYCHKYILIMCAKHTLTYKPKVILNFVPRLSGKLRTAGTLKDSVKTGPAR